MKPKPHKAQIPKFSGYRRWAHRYSIVYWLLDLNLNGSWSTTKSKGGSFPTSCLSWDLTARRQAFWNISQKSAKLLERWAVAISFLVCNHTKDFAPQDLEMCKDCGWSCVQRCWALLQTIFSSFFGIRVLCVNLNFFCITKLQVWPLPTSLQITVKSMHLELS